ncbi:hypothetical protein H0G86_001524 [Trichoderma simmonsii]|uniref:Uncharacterized protein n=1 Tax=Trichoderma simmonsii TaxID=1491479 RepID=A0A8G0L1R4_9HYPO|nr:hypothetical protein H0G86_001524 [Trichoderma simmonsii]
MIPRASCLHGVATGYTRPVPASSALSPSFLFLFLFFYYMCLFFISDPFNQTYSFSSVNIQTSYPSKSERTQMDKHAAQRTRTSPQRTSHPLDRIRSLQTP